jgi:hypothetical protein
MLNTNYKKCHKAEQKRTVTTGGSVTVFSGNEEEQETLGQDSKSPDGDLQLETSRIYQISPYHPCCFMQIT